MRRWSALLLLFLLFPLVVGPSPQVRAEEFDQFAYDPIYWEDWHYRNATNTITVNVTSDTYVDENTPDGNKDGLTVINLEHSGVGARECHGWFKFDLSAYAGLTLTAVSFFIHYAQFGGNEDGDVCASHNQTWEADEITWNDEPAYDTGSPIYDDFLFNGPLGSYEEISSAGILNHTQSYLGANMTIVIYDTDAPDGAYNKASSEEDGHDAYLVLTSTSDELVLNENWNANRTVSISAHNPSGTYKNATLYRETSIEDDEDSIKINAMLRTNASTGYQNATMLCAEYAEGSANKFFAVWVAADKIGVAYWNWEGVFTTSSTSHSVSETEYYTISTTLSAVTRRWSVIVQNESTTIVSNSYQIGATPPSVENITLTLNAQSCRTSANIVWVEAPFKEIDPLRGWVGTNTGDELGENPYNMYQTDADQERYQLKIMPFQGYKALWNWTMTANDGVQGMTRIRFKTRHGDDFGSLIMWSITRDTGVYYFDMDIGGVTAKRVTVTQEDQMAIAFWIDADGNAYMYAQVDPESHSFGDFWVFDVTAQVDFDSWGAIVEHVSEQAAAGTHNGNRWKEVELFCGAKEGISQPRFGGMWWQYNPLLVFFVNLITGIQRALAPIANAIYTFFKPAIDGFTNLLDNLPSILTVLNGIATDVVNILFAAIFTNFINNVMVALMLVGTAWNLLLQHAGLLVFGDASILVNFFTQIFLWIMVLVGLLQTAIYSMSTVMSLLLNFLLGTQAIAINLTGTITDYLLVVVYYVITYGPYLLMFHMIGMLTKAVKTQDYQPFVDGFMLYFTIAQVAFGIVRGFVSIVVQGIQVIFDIIPF